MLRRALSMASAPAQERKMRLLEAGGIESTKRPAKQVNTPGYAPGATSQGTRVDTTVLDWTPKDKEFTRTPHQSPHRVNTAPSVPCVAICSPETMMQPATSAVLEVARASNKLAKFAQASKRIKPVAHNDVITAGLVDPASCSCNETIDTPAEAFESGYACSSRAPMVFISASASSIVTRSLSRRMSSRRVSATLPRAPNEHLRWSSDSVVALAHSPYIEARRRYTGDSRSLRPDAWFPGAVAFLFPWRPGHLRCLKSQLHFPTRRG